MPICARLLVICLASVASTAAAAGEEFKVALSRPQSVGQRFTLHATGHSVQTRTITAPGATPQTQHREFSVELEGAMKVLEVDKASRQATKLQCEVVKLIEADKPLLEPGTIITIENAAGNGSTFTTDGVSLAPNAARAMGLMCGAQQPGAPSEDQMFGTDRPQQVGDTWRIHPEAAADGATKSGIKLTPDQINGQSKLVRVTNIDGRPALEVMTKMDVAAFTWPEKHVRHGTLAAAYGFVLPVDPSAMPLRSRQSMALHLNATTNVPNGETADVDFTTEDSNEIAFGPPSR